MSKIVDYFTDNGEDHKGCRFANAILFTDATLEKSHDLIQWLFPLHEGSKHSVYAPILTEADIKVLQSSKAAKKKLTAAYLRFRAFFKLDDEDDKHAWCVERNHNLLRITRIVRSLRIFGLEEQAKECYDDALKIAQRHLISQKTLHFWQKAMNDPIMAPMIEPFPKRF